MRVEDSEAADAVAVAADDYRAPSRSVYRQCGRTGHDRAEADHAQEQSAPRVEHLRLAIDADGEDAPSALVYAQGHGSVSAGVAPRRHGAHKRARPHIERTDMAVRDAEHAVAVGDDEGALSLCVHGYLARRPLNCRARGPAIARTARRVHGRGYAGRCDYGDQQHRPHDRAAMHQSSTPARMRSSSVSHGRGSSTGRL